MKYIAVLGRLPKISLAEIQAIYDPNAKLIGPELAAFETNKAVSIDRLGGSIKLGQIFSSNFRELAEMINTKKPEGKITIGVSSYALNSNHKNKKSAVENLVRRKAMELKSLLKKLGRNVRVVEARGPEISSATAFHNNLGEKPGAEEVILVGSETYLSLGVQNIDKYRERDQMRPARDAKVGMLPPKLAQILINLGGEIDESKKVLDPFCGTGVVLQEALILGQPVVGSDLNPRMMEYTQKNLDWLLEKKARFFKIKPELVEQKNQFLDSIHTGDATDFVWPKTSEIGLVACECFLGSPMSKPPVEIKLKDEKQNCKRIILGFLKNLAKQIEDDTPVVIAVPAWLREDGSYSRLSIIDEITDMGYNLAKFQGLSQSDMIYYREGQIVAREIIVLRKSKAKNVTC